METSAMSVDSTNSEIDTISMNSGSCVLTSLNIGLLSDLSKLNLPSNRDILKYYLFLRVAVQKKQKKAIVRFSYHTSGQKFFGYME